MSIPSASSSEARAISDYDLIPFQWLLEHIAASTNNSCQSSAINTSSPVSTVSAPADVIDSAFAALSARRRALEVESQHRRETDFVISILGGAWTKLNRGVDFDCILARGIGGITARWLTFYGLPLSS